jgi:hypothetical protein
MGTCCSHPDVASDPASGDDLEALAIDITVLQLIAAHREAVNTVGRVGATSAF